jgi:hypothetical protein
MPLQLGEVIDLPEYQDCEWHTSAHVIIALRMVGGVPTYTCWSRECWGSEPGGQGSSGNQPADHTALRAAVLTGQHAPGCGRHHPALRGRAGRLVERQDACAGALRQQHSTRHADRNAAGAQQGVHRAAAGSLLRTHVLTPALAML